MSTITKTQEIGNLLEAISDCFRSGTITMGEAAIMIEVTTKVLERINREFDNNVETTFYTR